MPSLRHCSVGPPRRAIHGPARLSRHPCRDAHSTMPAFGQRGLTGRRDQRPPRGGLVADLVLGVRVSPVGASLLAKAVVQLDRDWIGCRHRERARSHNGIGVWPGEPGRLSGRFREQARSHNEIGFTWDNQVGCQAASRASFAPTDLTGVRPGEPGRLSGRLASKLCSHRFDGCTTGRTRSAVRPPREQALLPQI